MRIVNQISSSWYKYWSSERLVFNAFRVQHSMGKKQVKKILTLRHLSFQTYWKLLSNDLEFCKEHSKPGIVDSFKTPDMAYWYLSSGESEDSDTESQRFEDASESESDTDYEAIFMKWKDREAKGIKPRQR